MFCLARNTRHRLRGVWACLEKTDTEIVLFKV
jgi:hypothetical protein